MPLGTKIVTYSLSLCRLFFITVTILTQMLADEF